MTNQEDGVNSENYGPTEDDYLFDKANQEAEEAFDKALSNVKEVPERLMALAFLETAVNRAAMVIPLQDILYNLNELAAQIESDIESGNEKDNDSDASPSQQKGTNLNNTNLNSLAAACAASVVV